MIEGRQQADQVYPDRRATRQESLMASYEIVLVTRQQEK